MSRVYLFKRYERLWHWGQAGLVLALIASGFEVHGTLRILGFERAVLLHEACGLGLIVLTLFTMFWHWTTGEVRQFIPTLKNVPDQIRFYTSGIFRNAPHPEISTPENKFNPVQKAAYFGLLILIFPIQIGAGVLYLGTPLWPGLIDRVGGLRTIALLHTAGAFAFISFLVVHLYMITTGRTLMSNLKSMLTGWVEE